MLFVYSSFTLCWAEPNGQVEGCTVDIRTTLEIDDLDRTSPRVWSLSPLYVAYRLPTQERISDSDGYIINACDIMDPE